MKRFLSLLLALMMVLSLVACGSDAADAGSEEDVSDIVEDTADDTSDEANTEEELIWWGNNYEAWGEQKENPELVLFRGNFIPPIELKNIYDFATEIIMEDIEDYNALVNSEIMIEDSAELYVYYGKSETGETDGDDWIKIEFQNFKNIDGTGEALPLKDLVNNNWWYVSEEFSIEDALGIYVEDEDWEKYGDTEDYVSNDEMLLYKIVEELGGPAQIHVYYMVDDGYRNNIYYYLLYEYPNYSIGVSVHEEERNGACGREIEEVRYAPNEYWPQYFEYLRGLYGDV